MLIETNTKEFFDNYYKTSGVVLTANIDDCKNFNGKVYVDDKNRYYLAVKYGEEEFVDIVQPYSVDLCGEISEKFPNAVYVTFIYDGYVGSESVNIGSGFYYHYKFQGTLNDGIKTEQPFTVSLITKNNVELAKKYDDLYQNSLPPNHMARLENDFKHIVGYNKIDQNKIYIACIDDIPIGFILAYYNPEYFAWSFNHIQLDEKYRQKGYGSAFLTEVTKDNLKQGSSLYYSGVSENNIASRKTAEKAGYKIAASKLCVKVK